ALKASTNHILSIFLYPLGAVETACALEVDVMAFGSYGSSVSSGSCGSSRSSGSYGSGRSRSS
ncbi:hypothetical protein Tco_1374586, partial [Tanacetum coccineum]